MYEKITTMKIMADYCDNKLPEFEPYWLNWQKHILFVK